MPVNFRRLKVNNFFIVGVLISNEHQDFCELRFRQFILRLGMIIIVISREK